VETDKVVGLVCKALPAQKPQSIILYSDRYNNLDRFAAAVMLPAKHQEVHRNVSIKRIPESEMFSFEETLRREFPQILDIFSIRTTTPWESSKPIHRLMEFDVHQTEDPRLDKGSSKRNEPSLCWTP
jgi:hypothetical protein